LPIKTLRIPTTDGRADAFAASPTTASGTQGALVLGCRGVCASVGFMGTEVRLSNA